jgi:hypothetical protein
VTDCSATVDAKHGDCDSGKDCEDRRRGGNHDAVNTVRQKLNAFADALVKQVANPARSFCQTNSGRRMEVNDGEADGH